MPRVTEILDYLKEPELVNWYRNNSRKKCDEISQRAIRIGTEVDLLVQRDIRDGGYLLPEGEEAITNCMRAWEKFKKDCPSFVGDVKEIQIELRDGELVGHPDFVMERERSYGIADLKCSRSIQPRYWTQVCQYLKMYQIDRIANLKVIPPKTYFAGILRLDKEIGDYEYKEIVNFDYIHYEQEVFKAYEVAYYHNMKNREQIRLMLEKEMLDA